MEMIIRKMKKEDAAQFEILQNIVFPDLIQEECIKTYKVCSFS